jgi:2-hydroxychromene-2-carboxylate isomerase
MKTMNKMVDYYSAFGTPAAFTGLVESMAKK